MLKSGKILLLICRSCYTYFRRQNMPVVGASAFRVSVSLLLLLRDKSIDRSKSPVCSAPRCRYLLNKRKLQCTDVEICRNETRRPSDVDTAGATPVNTIYMHTKSPKLRSNLNRAWNTGGDAPSQSLTDYAPGCLQRLM